MYETNKGGASISFASLNTITGPDSFKYSLSAETGHFEIRSRGYEPFDDVNGTRKSANHVIPVLQSCRINGKLQFKSVPNYWEGSIVDNEVELYQHYTGYNKLTSRDESVISSSLSILITIKFFCFYKEASLDVR